MYQVSLEVDYKGFVFKLNKTNKEYFRNILCSNRKYYHKFATKHMKEKNVIPFWVLNQYGINVLDIFTDGEKI